MVIFISTISDISFQFLNTICYLNLNPQLIIISSIINLDVSLHFSNTPHKMLT